MFGRGGSALHRGLHKGTRVCTFRSRNGDNQAAHGPTPCPDQQHMPPTSGCLVCGLVKPSLPLMPRMVPKMRADSGKLAGSASGSGAAAAAVRSTRREAAASNHAWQVACLMRQIAAAKLGATGAKLRATGTRLTCTRGPAVQPQQVRERLVLGHGCGWRRCQLWPCGAHVIQQSKGGHVVITDGWRCWRCCSRRCCLRI